MKWDKDSLGEAIKAWYVCEHCHACFFHQDMVEASKVGRWICEETGLWTRDAMDWFDADGEPARTPRSVAFYCWAIYSTWSTWLKIAIEWLKIKKYPAFWWMLGIVALTYPSINLMFLNVYDEISKGKGLYASTPC